MNLLHNTLYLMWLKQYLCC